MNPYEIAKELKVKSSEICKKYKAKVAVLRGYKRIFNKQSLKWRAALNLKFTGKPEDEVWGILIEVSDEEYEKIKRRERGYVCIGIQVLVNGELVDAVTFISSKLTLTDITPNKRYVKIVLEGAEYWSIKEKVLRNLYFADGTPFNNSSLFGLVSNYYESN